MGLLTPISFVSDLTDFFEEGWKKTRPLNDGENIELRFFNRIYDKQPSGKNLWSRISWQGNETETTFGGVGGRIKDRTGVIVVEHYIPLSRSQGNALPAMISMVTESIFEAQSSPGGIWFRRVRSQELAPEAPWLRSNTIVEFSYQEAV